MCRHGTEEITALQTRYSAQFKGDYRVFPREVQARVFAPGATQKVRRWGAIILSTKSCSYNNKNSILYERYKLSSVRTDKNVRTVIWENPMETTNDGKTEKNRKRNKGNSSDRRSGLGSVRASSSVNGTEPVGIVATDSTEENTFGTSIIWDGDSSTGKIVESLEMLERAFRTYVGGHQHRLEARLEESKEFEASFTQEVQRIKQEIYNLASKPKEPE